MGFELLKAGFIVGWKVLMENKEGILILLEGRRRVAEVGSLPGSQAAGIGVGRRARRLGGEDVWD